MCDRLSSMSAKMDNALTRSHRLIKNSKQCWHSCQIRNTTCIKSSVRHWVYKCCVSHIDELKRFYIHQDSRIVDTKYQPIRACIKRIKVKASAHYFKRIFKIIFLSIHLLPRMNIMLDFIWTLPVQLRGTRNKWTLQKILLIVGFEPSLGKETSWQLHHLNRSANSRLFVVDFCPIYIHIYLCYCHSWRCQNSTVCSKSNI